MKTLRDVACGQTATVKRLYGDGAWELPRERIFM